MRKYLFLFLLLFTITHFSQEEHAWVYFKDKPGHENYIENPDLILSQKSILKKNKKNIPIDFTDTPVYQPYIDLILQNQNFTYVAKSKWFNFIHLIGDEDLLQNLSSLDFVDKIIFAKKESRSIIFDKIEINQTRNDEDNPYNQIEMINLGFLHDQGFTGEGVSIAIFDSGFKNVNSLSGFERIRSLNKIKYTYDFVDNTAELYQYTGNSHGTLVFSTMAGYIESEFIGTAPDAEYYLFRTEDVSSETPAEESFWIEAIETADSLGVDLTNTSLGYKNYDNINYSYQNYELDGNTAIITQAANMAFSKGIILVNSAGNSSSSGVIAPADSPNVLSIGAVDFLGDYIYFSSQGNEFQPTIKPDISAQGYRTFVINSNDQLTRSSGTSFSSPVLAGAIACLYQSFPDFSNSKIYNIIRNSSSQNNSPDNFLGYGIPDFEKAYNLSINLNNDTFAIYPNPIIDELNVLSFSNEKYIFDIYSVNGRLVFSKEFQGFRTKTNLDFLSKGIYILKLSDENNNETLLKILKR
jgi:subtilisin family serine protease